MAVLSKGSSATISFLLGSSPCFRPARPSMPIESFSFRTATLVFGRFSEMYWPMNIDWKSVVGDHLHGPGVLVGLGAEAVAAGGHQDVGHLLLVQVLHGGGMGRVAQGADHREDLVLLHQLARHLHGPGRVIEVVLRLVDDLAAADASLGVVDVVEVGFGACRGWSRKPRPSCRCRSPLPPAGSPCR